MTLSQRQARAWMWVNVASLGLGLVLMLVGLALGTHPRLQTILLIISAVSVVFAASTAWVVAYKSRH